VAKERASKKPAKKVAKPKASKPKTAKVEQPPAELFLITEANNMLGSETL